MATQIKTFRFVLGGMNPRDEETSVSRDACFVEGGGDVGKFSRRLIIEEKGTLQRRASNSKTSAIEVVKLDSMFPIFQGIKYIALCGPVPTKKLRRLRFALSLL